MSTPINSAAPIHHLPIEILQDILLSVLEPFFTELFDGKRTLKMLTWSTVIQPTQSLSQVCRSWARIVIQTPPIARYVFFHPISLLNNLPMGCWKQRLEHCRYQPICLWVHYTSRCHQYLDDFLDAIQNVPFQIQKLVIYQDNIEPFNDVRFKRLVETLPPAVQLLMWHQPVLDTMQATRKLPFPPFTPTTKELIAVNNVPPSWPEEAEATQIRKLTIRSNSHFSHQTLLLDSSRLFELAPHLDHLIILFSHFGNLFPLYSYTTHRFSCLHTLELSWTLLAVLGGKLQFPNLKKVLLHNFNHYYSIRWDTLDIICSYTPGLTHFHLFNVSPKRRNGYKGIHGIYSAALQSILHLLAKVRAQVASLRLPDVVVHLMRLYEGPPVAAPHVNLEELIISSVRGSQLDIMSTVTKWMMDPTRVQYVEEEGDES